MPKKTGNEKCFDEKRNKQNFKSVTETKVVFLTQVGMFGFCLNNNNEKSSFFHEEREREIEILTKIKDKND